MSSPDEIVKKARKENEKNKKIDEYMERIGDKLKELYDVYTGNDDLDDMLDFLEDTLSEWVDSEKTLKKNEEENNNK